MYQTFLYQYRLRPDTRFINAFNTLVNLHAKYRGVSTGENLFHIGPIKEAQNEVIIPVLKNDQVVKTIRLSLPMTFSSSLAALDQCMEAMEEGNFQILDNPIRGTYWLDQLQSAIRYFYMVDPRGIINGLVELEKLWRKEGADSRIMLAASRGYAMLLLGLTPDPLQYSDQFASHALSFLAMAKRKDPRLPTFREEALLAMNMGYNAHAENLLGTERTGLSEPTDEILEAYFRQDIMALKFLLGDGSRVLGYYILARLYREIGQHRESAQVAEGLFKRFPGLYPAIVEIIYSAPLNIAKLITIYYPLDILTRMEHQISPNFFDDEKTSEELISSFSGDKARGNISLSRFSDLLLKWRPLERDFVEGLFVDEKRIKTIFRGLYSGAVYLRFNLLLNRWNVLERATNFVNLLVAEDDNHPMVLQMLAEVKNQTGSRKEVDVLFSKVINHPGVTAGLATRAHYFLNDINNKIRLTPVVANRVDGRPKNLFNLGLIFQRLWHYDLAEKYFDLGLAYNPFRYEKYKELAQVTGDQKVIPDALERFPFSFVLLEEAGDFFKDRNEDKNREKAVECFDKAIELVPTHESLPLKKAKALRSLKRFDEATDTIKIWLRKNARNDLTTTFYRTTLASIYLEMGKPQSAFETLSAGVDSYQAGAMMTLARTFEKLNQPDKAEETYRKALSRYPSVDHVLSGTAAFMWRNGRDKEAAELIDRGRKIMGQFSHWYFKDFMKVFARSPELLIINTIDTLIAYGATFWEINSLGFLFKKEGRSEVAYKILCKSPAQGVMGQLEKIVDIYKVVREWRGKEEAQIYMHNAVSREMRGPLAMVLFKEGLFEQILSEVPDPNEYPPKHREFIWLQKLIAWLALNEKPEELARTFEKHYKKSTSDYYHSIGQFMLGRISRADLLGLIKTPKQRCEFAYYIGLSERLRGNFREATNWYLICRETLLTNNGEYHWAFDEMFWWAHMGTKKRHRLITEDIEAYHNR